MAFPLLPVVSVLAIKEEATVGVMEPTLAAVDCSIKSYSVKLAQKSEAAKRQRQGNLGNDIAVPEAMSTELTFISHLHGKGATGVPNWAAKLLPSCGLVLSSQTYAGQAAVVTNGNWKTLTAGRFVNGRRSRARSMMGSFRLSAEAGRMGILEWTFIGGCEATGSGQGVTTDPTDSALLGSITYESVIPPIWQGAASLSIAGVGYPVKKFEFDLGNQLTLREDSNSPGGYLSAWIGNRLPTFSVDPESLLRATKSWEAAYRAGTEHALSVKFGSTANNIIELTATIQVDKAPEEIEDEGKLRDMVTFQVNADSAAIIFT